MLKVTHEETPLTDELAVNAILDELDVPYFCGTSGLSEDSDVPWRSYAKPPDWTRRLYHNYLSRHWMKGCAVWVAANKKTGTLHRVVMEGLLNEAESELLHSEFRRRKAKLADVESIAREIAAGRQRRQYQQNFLHAVRDVRNYFKWQDGVAVESEGRFLPISALSFSADDVTLLRAIYERLPPTIYDRHKWHEAPLRIDEAACPHCGSTGRAKRISAAKKRSDLRNRLGELNRNYPAEAFNTWTQTRLKVGGFTVATELYADYQKWAAKHGDYTAERRMSKDTVLTLNKWGRLMVAGPHTPLRRNTGKGYRVTLRRV